MRPTLSKRSSARQQTMEILSSSSSSSSSSSPSTFFAPKEHSKVNRDITKNEPKFIIIDDDDDDDDDGRTPSSKTPATPGFTPSKKDEPINIDDDIDKLLFLDGFDNDFLDIPPSSSSFSSSSSSAQEVKGATTTTTTTITSTTLTQSDTQSEPQTCTALNKTQMRHESYSFTTSKDSDRLVTTPKKRRKHVRKDEEEEEKSSRKKRKEESKHRSSRSQKKKSLKRLKVPGDGVPGEEKEEEEEVIDDDDDDGIDYNDKASIRTMFMKAAAYSQGSISTTTTSSSSAVTTKTTTTVPKQKRSVSFSEQENKHLHTTGAKTLSSSSSPPSIFFKPANTTPNTMLFTDKYTPETSAELTVSEASVSTFREWLNSVKSHTNRRILIISGPSGAGKTAMVRVVSKEQRIDTIEYSPYSSSSSAMARYNNNNNEGNAYAASGVEDFRSWVLRAAKGPSILSGCALRLLVVEDFPFINSENSLKFRGVFADYVRLPRAMPMVVILSDSERFSRHGGSSGGSKTSMACSIVSSFLLPASEMNPFVDSMKVNPVTLKKMRQALTKVSAKFGVKLPMSAVTDIAAECGKDIRSAMNMLQFSRFDFKDKMNCRKDMEVSLFHGAGKILHPRFRDLSSATSSMTSSSSTTKKEKSYPENFLLECSGGVKPHQIVECAVENMYGFMSNVDNLADAWEAISLGDAIGGCGSGSSSRGGRSRQGHGKIAEEAQLLVASYGIMNNITEESHKFFALHASKLRSMEQLVKENSKALSSIFGEFAHSNSQHPLPPSPSPSPPLWILSKYTLLTEVVPFSGHLNHDKECFRIVKELHYDIPDEMITTEK